MTLLTLSLTMASFGQVFASEASKPAAAAASVQNADTTGHWAESTLKEWQQQGLISGYEDGSLKPDLKITRAEFTSLVNKSFGFTDITAVSYKDIKESDWFYNDISKAAAAAYIKGYQDNTFKPNKPLTREELAVIIASLLQLNSSNPEVSFTDTAASHTWSKGSIAAVVEAGLMQGYSGKFRPQQTATRAEAVVVLDRALKQRADSKTVVYDQAGTYGPETGSASVTGTVYLNAPGITLRNTVINGNLVIGENVGKGDIALKNVTVKGTTTINGGGRNSIHVEDSVLVTVIVDKKDGSIRIVTEGSTSVQQITLQSGALLQEAGAGSGFGNVSLSQLIPANSQVEMAGTFNTVDVFATSLRVSLTSGSVQNLNVGASAANTAIDVASGAGIGSLILDAIAHVTGQGTIGTAYVNANGCTIAQTPANVVPGTGVTVSVGTAAGNSGTGNPGTVTGSVYGFEGRILDVDQLPVAGMTIKFRKGFDNKTGEVAATVVTDADGYYYAELAPGIYTGELVKEGFITTYLLGVSLTDYKNLNQNATAIKLPKSGEIRIVLTWNEQPSDEDSHLVGPSPNGLAFHTWYGDKEYWNNGTKYADLDLDDTTSYGPETTTIRKQVNGTYTFYVHNYSGNGEDNTNTLAASGAKVEVYEGSNTAPVKTYNIPAASNTSEFWYVFDMKVDGESLSFVDKNELTDVRPREYEPTDELQPVSLSQINIANNPGAADSITVSGLSAGNNIEVRNRDGLLIAQSSPVPSGSDTVTLTDLNLGAGSSAIYINVHSPEMNDWAETYVTVLSEADYAQLTTTVAGAFADHEVPVTTAVYQNVYLANPGVTLPQNLTVSVMSVEPVSTVSQDVYLDTRWNALRLTGFNGTDAPVQYKVTLEIRVASSAVIKEITITVPTVKESLNRSTAYAEEQNAQLQDSSLQAVIDAAKLVLNNPDSTVEEYLEALEQLNDALYSLTFSVN